jgi:dTDP-4-dehydrorhamnose 3,5-epimerase
MDKISQRKLDIFDTKDITDSHVNGNLTVIWRDYDKIIDFAPKMLYMTSVNPGEIKGPHLHTKRDSSFVCLKGKVVFVIQDKDGNYQEIESSEENPIMVNIPKGIASAHINTSEKISSIIAIASIAWRENDNEMENITFDNYNWSKWKIIKK